MHMHMLMPMLMFMHMYMYMTRLHFFAGGVLLEPFCIAPCTKSSKIVKQHMQFMELPAGTK